MFQCCLMRDEWTMDEMKLALKLNDDASADCLRAQI